MKTNQKGKNIMKDIRTIVMIFAFASVCFCLNAADDEILLPDISTTILKTEEGIPVESDAVPDFRLLLPETGITLPDIADTGLAPDTFIPPKTDYTAEITDGSESEVNNVFIEGAVGGGFPGLFSGDFSIYRNEGTEPFSLKFSHLTENGYGLHTAAAGFSNSTTKLSGQKRFMFTDKLCLDLEGVYSTKADGLQGRSPLFYMLSNQDISGKADFVWTINDSMSLSSDLGLMFNNQFAGYNSPLPVGMSGSALCLLVKPRVSFLYKLPLSDGMELDLQTGVEYEGGTNQNRVAGGFSAAYIIGDYGTASASMDLVWTKNMAATVVLPFQLAFRAGQNLPFTGTISGGLKSSPVDFSELQKKVPYMFTDETPFEESLWFVSTNCSVPIAFTFDETNSSMFCFKKVEPTVKIDFAKTAFGNESLRSFTKNNDTGLMTAQLTDRLVFDTAVSTSLSFLAGGICDIDFALGWKGSWFDREVLEEAHSLSVKLGISHENGIWGSEVDLLVTFLGEVPDLKLSAFYKLSNSMRLELELADFIKLVTGKDRPHCGAYIQRGGYAALYVKVFF
ncbi:MAG: hypothetical protein K5930_10925 [Treponemataceae bacterium]|nr:hypothetical protein [Treponemataceae bacterium]